MICSSESTLRSLTNIFCIKELGIDIHFEIFKHSDSDLNPLELKKKIQGEPFGHSP